MSMCYWMNEGIGITASRLYPHLDMHKCRLLLRALLPNEEIPDDDFDIDDYMYGNSFDNIGEFLCLLDDTNTMTYGDSGDGEYYFLYAPSYPWDRKDNEPISLQEVHERIIDVVLKVTNLTRRQAEDLIDDDIYEYGCG